MRRQRRLGSGSVDGPSPPPPAQIGVTRSGTITTQMHVLENCIRKELDAVAPRVFAVLRPLKVCSISAASRVLLLLRRWLRKPCRGGV